MWRRAGKFPIEASGNAYETWCRENGDYPLGQKLFNAKMAERGFAVKRSGANGSRDWHGIGLADDGILL